MKWTGHAACMTEIKHIYIYAYMHARKKPLGIIGVDGRKKLI
jgi:hypothetical protein